MRQPAPRAGPLGRLFAWLGGAFFAASLLYFLYAYVVRFGTTTAGTGTAAPLAINTTLFTFFALHHSALARSGAKRLVERWVTPALERALYVWVSSALFLLCCLWWQEIPGTVYRFPTALHPAGWLVQAAGLWITVAAARTLDMLDLAGVRQALGVRRRTLLQAGGVYAFVRHPIYLGWVLLTFGAPHMTATRFSFACVSMLYLIAAIPFEERALVSEFGDEYVAHQRRVRWRMIPGLY